MAGENRRQARALELLEALEGEPHRFDLFRALRRLECAFADRPRLGEALKPADEPVRLGQDPSTAFADGPIASFSRGEGGVPRLLTQLYGVLGPNGPLPLHLTEYARDRLRNGGDATLARFLDVFHHRMMALLYRAHADAEPTIVRDRPSSDRFALFVGALFGMGLPSTRGRDLTSDLAKLHYAGLLARQRRDADGLGALVGDLFQVPSRVEQFVGEWVDVPPANRSRLGVANCVLGADALLGTRTWLCSGKFRLVLGPLQWGQFEHFLPGAAGLEKLADAVRVYAGDELAWDLKLVLAKPASRSMALGRSRLGWDSWIGLRPSTWKGVERVFAPEARARSAPSGPRPTPDRVPAEPQRSKDREQAHV